MSIAPITVPANYAKLTTAQQNSFWVNALGKFPGTVSTAWVKSNADLKPYQGDTAVEMYGKLAAEYPEATPQQRGSTVYQVWLGAGLAQAVGDSAIGLLPGRSRRAWPPDCRHGKARSGTSSRHCRLPAHGYGSRKSSAAGSFSWWGWLSSPGLTRKSAG